MMEKNIKDSAYLSITESFCCIAESNQYCKSTIHQLKKKKEGLYCFKNYPETRIKS